MILDNTMRYDIFQRDCRDRHDGVRMSKQILIVEDEQIIGTDIRRGLEAMGYAVAACVASGEEAVRKAAELEPDLVLMDIQLGPGMDGIEAAKRIHARCDIPIIYVSGNFTEDNMEMIKSTNPFGFLVKPFEDNELRLTIEMALYRHQMEEALSRSEEKYRAILENIDEAYFEVDLSGNFTFFNDATLRMAGMPRDELMGVHNLRFVEPEAERKIYEAFRKIEETGKPQRLIDCEIVRPDRTRQIFELSVSLMKDPSHTPVGFRGVARDITERKLAEETLRQSEERYRTLFEHNPIETIIVDKRAVITGFNQAKAQSGDRLPRPGDVMYRDYAAKHANGMYDELMECIETGTPKEFPDARYGDKSLYIKISPFPEGAIITSIDVTASKRLEERLSHLATHDPLTGLPNRTLFTDRLSLELIRAQRSGKQLAVMLLDLDNFKEINDSWGHTVGDEVLKIIGTRLPEFLRKSDSIARMGGDEFLILLPDIERAEDARRIGLKLLDAFKDPFVVEGKKLPTTTSIGYAVYPDDGHETEILIKNADIAMYSVKEGGRNGCRQYHAHMRRNPPRNGKTPRMGAEEGLHPDG